ncbi:acyl carrier protein [Actinomadura sp. 9N215]|uniref:acyl carrier protein n=1 Tax=Actinomadura sp. 9N215 TaxID=3375150 RepID=UPI00379B9C95
MTSSTEHTETTGKTGQEPADAAAIEADLLSFLEAKTKAPVEPDVDLFASGAVSSMFAMELVVRLEQSYGVAIVGPDLVLDNFRTVQRMIDLVLRLRSAAAGAPGG